MTEKSKSRGFTSALVRILVAVIIASLIGFIFWFGNAYQSQFYSSQEVSAICDMLNLLPTNQFCEATRGNNYQMLQNALIEQYSLNITHYNDLFKKIKGDSDCSSVTGGKLNNNRRVESFKEAYVCYYVLLDKRTTLRISFDKDHYVQSYHIYDATS
jgi:hypothetical protein